MEPAPLQCKCRVLATGLPGKSQCVPFYSLFIKACPVSHPLVSLSLLTVSQFKYPNQIPSPIFQRQWPFFTRYIVTLRQTIPLISVWTWESIDRNFRPCDKLVLVTAAQTKPGPVTCRPPGSSASKSTLLTKPITPGLSPAPLQLRTEGIP